MYITQEYYTNYFYGEPVDPVDFPSLCERAEEIVEEMTMYRVTGLTFQAFPQDIQERVKKAVCAEIEYLNANGGTDMDNGYDLQSAGLGKFNYTKASGTGGSSRQSVYAPRSIRLLAPTGLLYRGGAF